MKDHNCIFNLIIEEHEKELAPILEELSDGTTTDFCELCRRFSKRSDMVRIRYMERVKSLGIAPTARRIRPLETVARCRW